MFHFEICVKPCAGGKQSVYFYLLEVRNRLIKLNLNPVVLKIILLLSLFGNNIDERVYIDCIYTSLFTIIKVARNCTAKG